MEVNGGACEGFKGWKKIVQNELLCGELVKVIDKKYLSTQVNDIYDLWYWLYTYTSKVY